MIVDDYRIELNFLPVDGRFPSFTIFRQSRGASDKSPDPATMSYTLPTDRNSDTRSSYWIRTKSADGFEEFKCLPEYNNNLTCWILQQTLIDRIRSALPSHEFSADSPGFRREIALLMRSHPEGNEMLVLQPYFLRETRQFGVVADYHFALAHGVEFSRVVQQLSLSLDRHFKRNLDCYLDRVSRIHSFLETRRQVLDGLKLPGSDATFAIGSGFVSIPARRLKSKVYTFANNKDSKSQFTGLRDHGPLHQLDAPPSLLFVFREQDRIAARALASALRGDKKQLRFSFPGFESLFKSKLQIDSNPIILDGLATSDMDAAINVVKERCKTVPSTLPILVIPEGENNGYLAHKADSSNAGIATQVCTLRVIQDENALKWAIANIALQIFCKAGGQPWKVRPFGKPTLIVGISQSHKFQDTDTGRKVEKYFAFTVMTDNSGLFQRIQVLGEGGDKEQYIAQLRASLKSILSTASDAFERVVVHASFRLRKEEMEAIQAEVSNKSGSVRCQFAVVKVNHKCRFFGSNKAVNSLVPFEGTVVRLGFREYLVWFEGIYPDKPNVTKAYPGPTHLQIMHVSDSQAISDDELLQDILNLSGANWRGFNAKSSPVSVFYCHLVADRVHEFHRRGLPLPEVPLLKPWFL